MLRRRRIAGFFQERPRRPELAAPVMLGSQFRERLRGLRINKRLSVDTSVGAQRFAPIGGSPPARLLKPPSRD